MMVWLYYFIIFSLAWETCNQLATQREKKCSNLLESTCYWKQSMTEM